MNDINSPIALLKAFAEDCRNFAATNEKDATARDIEATKCRLRASQHIASAEAAERAVALLEAAEVAGGAGIDHG